MKPLTRISPLTLLLMENLMRLKPSPKLKLLRQNRQEFSLLKRKKEELKELKTKRLPKHKLKQKLQILTASGKNLNKYLKMKSKETRSNTISSLVNVILKNMQPNLRPRVRAKLFKLLLSPTKVSRSTSLVVPKTLRESLLIWKTKLAICKAWTSLESKLTNVLASRDSVKMLSWRNVNSSVLLMTWLLLPSKLIQLTLQEILAKRKHLTFMTPTMVRMITTSLLLDLTTRLDFVHPSLLTFTGRT